MFVTEIKVGTQKITFHYGRWTCAFQTIPHSHFLTPLVLLKNGQILKLTFSQEMKESKNQFLLQKSNEKIYDHYINLKKRTNLLSDTSQCSYLIYFLCNSTALIFTNKIYYIFSHYRWIGISFLFKPNFLFILPLDECTSRWEKTKEEKW